MIRIQQLDHLGIRVMDAKRAIAFYEKLGFTVRHVSDFDAVTIMDNDDGVELNLITNGNDDVGGKNILMDVEKKHPGFTHVALRVASIKDTHAALVASGITPSQGPVTFGGTGVSIFIRDPDRNVIELRGRDQKLDEIPGLKFYEP